MPPLDEETFGREERRILTGGSTREIFRSNEPISTSTSLPFARRVVCPIIRLTPGTCMTPNAATPDAFLDASAEAPWATFVRTTDALRATTLHHAVFEQIAELIGSDTKPCPCLCWPIWRSCAATSA